MESMVRMLAQLPEQQRREMIKTRLATFAEMGDEERTRAMSAMAAALQKLDQESQKKLTYTRLEVLAEEFDDATRKKLMGTHMNALMSLSKEQAIGDIGVMVSVMGQCHESCRMKDMGTMKEIMAGMTREKRGMMMQMLPPDVQKMLMS
jgi:phage-related protein